MNPADVLALPVGFLDVMADVITDEDRARRRAQLKADAQRQRR